MPKLISRNPAYLLHRASGQACVNLSGKRFYLGPHGTQASRREYDRLVGEWIANGRRLPGMQDRSAGLLIKELRLAYFQHVQGYYVKNGKATSEVETTRQALRFLRPYDETEARSFGPLSLKAVRQSMIEHGLSRGYINKQVNRLKRLFAWASSEERLPVEVFQALATVEGLRKGRTAAKEKGPIRPVSDEVVEKTLPHLRPMLAAMVRVQRLSGMRPQEVVEMRVPDLDRSDPGCWAYRPGRHKTEHHERERVVFLGPRAQAYLLPHLEAASQDPSGQVFSPRRSEEERNEAKRATRRLKRWPSHAPARRRKYRPKRQPADTYTVASYRRAIARACQAAGVEQWSPHRLRHTAGTEVRRQFGLEAAQAVLGHAELGVTQVYAEADRARAREVMRAIG